METNVVSTTTDKSRDKWKAIIIIILTSQVQSQRLNVEQKPKNATVSVGDSITQTCVFNRPIDCIWYKGDWPYKIKLNEGIVYTGESKTGEHTRDCSFRISNVSEHDFGQWRCSSYSINGNPPVSSEVIWITEQVKGPSLTVEQSPQNATESVGESVTLTCVFSEPVDCIWVKDDQPYRIKPEDGNTFTGDSSTGLGTRDCSIRISTVTEDDFAKWRCATYASKGVTSVTSRWIWINKWDASRPFIIEQSPTNATAHLGETVTLTCVFSRPVDCNWLKDDQPYRIKPEDGNTYTGDSSTGENTRDCSIRISTVTKEDFAKWSCGSYASKGLAPVSSEGVWITKREKVNTGSWINPGLIAGIVGTILTVIIVATAILLRRRERRKRRKKVSHASLAIVTPLNTSTGPNSRGHLPPMPSTSTDIVLYEEGISYVRQCSVRRADVDWSGYLVALPVYEEIKDPPPTQVKAEDDKGYIALL